MRRRRLFGIGILLLSLFISAVVYCTRPQHTDLLNVSTRIMDMQNGSIEVAFPMSHTYWVSDNVAVAHERSGEDIWSRAYSFDIGTGARTEMAALSKRIEGLRGKTWRLSPDKKWLLWRESRRGKKDRYIASRRDGSEEQTWDVDDYEGDMVWLPDSRSFAVLVNTNQKPAPGHVSRLHIYQFGNRKFVHNIVFPDDGVQVELLGTLPDGRILVWLKSFDPFDLSKPTTLLAIGSDGKSPLVKTIQVRLPFPGGCDGIELSPDGERLAWIVSVFPPKQKPFLEHWLDRLLNRSSKHYAEALFVSRSDGSGFRELGRIPYEFSFDFDSFHMPEVYFNLNGWLPKNKQVSFLLYDRRDAIHAWLYTIPVPN